MRHNGAFGGDADHCQPPCRYQMCEAVDMAVPEEVCMTDAAPEPEGSEEEIRRKFREALERKRAKHADANAARGGKDAGKVHGARGLARSRRSFRRKTGG
jgi:hypothetical protein